MSDGQRDVHGTVAVMETLKYAIGFMLVAALSITGILFAIFLLVAVASAETTTTTRTTTTRTTTTLPIECRERRCADGSYPRVVVEGPCYEDEHKKGRVKCAIRPRAGCHPSYYVYYRPESTIRIVCPEDEEDGGWWHP